jgi:hypothetical protein
MARTGVVRTSRIKEIRELRPDNSDASRFRMKMAI